MLKSFDDLIAKLDNIPLKKVSVAVAQDEHVLEAVKVAKERKIADAILVGDEDKIRE
ncbi:MAG: phosphate butyryltransferase, partial [Lachnospiraceae bacterium]|nr:phosphate butyryltransferase [Lachnospiraceae bacterium]